MILAVPGARHLFGLKEILYEHPYENEEKIHFTMDLRFRNVSLSKMKFTLPNMISLPTYLQ